MTTLNNSLIVKLQIVIQFYESEFMNYILSINLIIFLHLVWRTRDNLFVVYLAAITAGLYLDYSCIYLWIFS